MRLRASELGWVIIPCRLTWAMGHHVPVPHINACQVPGWAPLMLVSGAWLPGLGQHCSGATFLVQADPMQVDEGTGHETMLYPSGSLPCVTLRPLSVGDRLLVAWLSLRVRRHGGAYLVHTDPLQADIGCHGGSEVAQPLHSQHSSCQAGSCRSAAWRWLSPCSPSRASCMAKGEHHRHPDAGLQKGANLKQTPAWQMQPQHCTAPVTHSTNIPELACLGAIHVQLKCPRVCAHVGIRGCQDEACSRET